MLRNPRSFGLLFSFLLILSIWAVRVGSRPDRRGGSVPRTQGIPRSQPGSPKVAVLSLAESAANARLPKQPLSLFSDIRGPVRIELAPDGHFFLIDDGNGEVIREFSSEGLLLQVFQGSAVAKIKSVADLTAVSDRVWVADLLGSAIHIFDRKARSWETLALKEEPYRLEPVGPDHSRLLIMRVGGRWLFDITNDRGEILESLAGDLLVDQRSHSFALDGFIARSGDAIIFSGKHLGLLGSFSDQGRLNWIASPIAPPDKPVVMTRGNRRWVDHGSIQASYSLAGSHDSFCVLARRVHSLRVRSFIDVYRQRDGAYLKSLQLPGTEAWTSVGVGGDYLFAASDQGVYRWPMEVLAADGNTSFLSASQSVVKFSKTKGDAQ